MELIGWGVCVICLVMAMYCARQGWNYLHQSIELDMDLEDIDELIKHANPDEVGELKAARHLKMEQSESHRAYMLLLFIVAACLLVTVACFIFITMIWWP